VERELERLEKDLSAALEKLKHWIEELKKDGEIESDEFMMLFEIMTDGITHLTTLAEILLTLQLPDDARHPEFKQSAADAMKHIRNFVNIIKVAAFDE